MYTFQNTLKQSEIHGFICKNRHLIDQSALNKIVLKRRYIHIDMRPASHPFATPVDFVVISQPYRIRMIVGHLSKAVFLILPNSRQAKDFNSTVNTVGHAKLDIPLHSRKVIVKYARLVAPDSHHIIFVHIRAVFRTAVAHLSRPRGIAGYNADATLPKPGQRNNKSFKDRKMSIAESFRRILPRQTGDMLP